jgi:mono/diheme cytochrome c family protein
MAIIGGNMRPPILNSTLAAVSVATLISLKVATTSAQDMEVIMGGDIEYQNHCAVCHGVDGKGQGLMSRYLTVQPADLTLLSKKNGGTFPFWEIYRAIDGREVRGHGTREMPIWGDRFRAQAGGNDSGSRAQVAGRLLGLVFYLQYIQE